MATKEQIYAAADAISAEGGNPTLAAVRAHMGGGSYTDISAAMQSWTKSTEPEQKPPNRRKRQRKLSARYAPP